MVVFLGNYAAAELSHFVEMVPRVPVSAVTFVRWGLRYGLFDVSSFHAIYFRFGPRGEYIFHEPMHEPVSFVRFLTLPEAPKSVEASNSR